MEKQIKIAIVGLGNRGSAYGNYALRYPENIKISYICDKDDIKRTSYAEKHRIPKENQFSDFDMMLECIKDNPVDALIVSTIDNQHYEMVIKGLKAGLNILCEKPMSPLPEQCMEMGELSEKYQRILMICHVLRYNPFFVKIKELVSSGTIGDVVSVQHCEDVSYEHYTHSYVRGNTKNKEQSSPMILAKSCHDMDILHWLLDKNCLEISSYGSLSYFNREHAPAGATEYCLGGCPLVDTCDFSAKRIYLSENLKWPVSMISVDKSIEARTKAVEKGKYGKCVFLNDNNVVDHQIVNMLFEGGVTASFSMQGFSQADLRRIHIQGTKGEISGKMEEREIHINLFDGTNKVMFTPVVEGDHGGGDTVMMHDFVRILREHSLNQCRTSAKVSVQSHMMAFAAEESRLSHMPVGMKAYMDSFR